jgi:midasin (ATPase involved in ribosome maturation)
LIEKGDEIETEKKDNEHTVNKIDFLKDFKNFDPDNSKGEEKQSSVEVSLTSKK